MKTNINITLPFSIPVYRNNENLYTFQFILNKLTVKKFPKLTKNEKKFIKDVKNFEDSIKKECDYMGLSNDKLKELTWNTIKELQKNKIATDQEVKMFLKARPEYLEFV
jgi:hypothetical protein